MRPRTISRLAAACALLPFVAGCVTVKIAAIPPPEREIATEADMEEVGTLLPDPRTLTAERVLHYQGLLFRLSESVAYAEMAERRLK